MDELSFIETLKIIDGQFIDPSAHLKRICATIQEVYKAEAFKFSLSEDMIPMDKRQGVVKCRIEYNNKQIRHIAFEQYRPRMIRSLKLVHHDNVDYHLKYADRTSLVQLLEHKGDCDDILIVKRGKLTDTSYSNIVLFNGSDYVTPSTYLLNGTKRQHLVEQGIVKVMDITVNDLKSFKRLYLINAMLDIEDQVFLEIEHIRYK